MRAFGIESGVVVPLDRANVDTDQIIPKQFLKSIRRTGFGDNLFDSWRFLDEGDIGITPNERQINHDFVLNLPRYQGGGVLLARENIGSGSSREHSVWALMEKGFKAVVAPSFADIFYNNCFKNGLLPIVLKEEKIEELFQLVAREPGFALTIHLQDQRIERTDGTHVDFEIDATRKRKLVEGLDDIDLTWAHTEAIRRFEADYRIRRSWLF